MSTASHGGGPADQDSGAQENPFAVWLRNVPTWLDEERFYHKLAFYTLIMFFLVFTPRLENGPKWTRTNLTVLRTSKTALGLGSAMAGL